MKRNLGGTQGHEEILGIGIWGMVFPGIMEVNDHEAGRKCFIEDTISR